jgi:hypothetical protein
VRGDRAHRRRQDRRPGYERGLKRLYGASSIEEVYLKVVGHAADR